jgi:hypothetical protein
MIDELDLQKLNTLVASIKADSESASEFTIRFLECLMKRYHLKEALKKTTAIDDIPDDIIKILKEGNIPTKEDLLALDFDTQNFLITEMVWKAGMGKICTYSYDIEQEEGIPGIFECIMAMPDVSTAHWRASYLFAALALLMSTIPSYDMVNSITNNFDNSEENIRYIEDRFVEICRAIYVRYKEDDWFLSEVEQGEIEEE